MNHRPGELTRLHLQILCKDISLFIISFIILLFDVIIVGQEHESRVDIIIPYLCKRIDILIQFQCICSILDKITEATKITGYDKRVTFVVEDCTKKIVILSNICSKLHNYILHDRINLEHDCYTIVFNHRFMTALHTGMNISLPGIFSSICFFMITGSSCILTNALIIIGDPSTHSGMDSVIGSHLD